MAYEIRLVCLYRCKHCGTRLFDHDIKGHLERHGVYANGDSRKHFLRGRRDTPEKPGYYHTQIYQAQHGKPKPAIAHA